MKLLPLLSLAAFTACVSFGASAEPSSSKDYSTTSFSLSSDIIDTDNHEEAFVATARVFAKINDSATVTSLAETTYVSAAKRIGNTVQLDSKQLPSGYTISFLPESVENDVLKLSVFITLSDFTQSVDIFDAHTETYKRVLYLKKGEIVSTAIGGTHYLKTTAIW